MKKFVAAIVLGAIVGSVAYKLKKEYDDRKMLEKELDLLSANEEETEEACECECSKETCECEEQTCECEEETPLSEFIEEVKEEASEVAQEAQEIVHEVVEEASEVAQDVQEEVTETIEEVKEVVQPEEKKTTFLEESLEDNPLEEDLENDFKEMLENKSDSMIHQLVEENDELEDERPIQHFIDFKSLDDMEAFKTTVSQKGYVVTKGQGSYQLTVLHIAPINRSELLVNVYYIAKQASKHNGSYKGWQSRKVF